MINNRFNVSVIIPVYARDKLLFRAIESVLNQHLPAHEIIVVDDGSPVDISEQISCRYPMVKTIRNECNRGVSQARNRGIKHSNGNWIAFLDSDDQWLPEKLQSQYDTLLETHALICHTNEIWYRDGKHVNQGLKHRKYGGDIFNFCLPLCVVSPSSVVMKKSLFKTYGYFDESLPACEDYDLWIRLSAKIHFEFLDKPMLIKYGGHEDQLSRKYWGMDRFRIAALENILTTGDLNRQQIQAVLNQLVIKCRIFANGAKKRGNLILSSNYHEKLNKHTLQLASFMNND